MFKQKKGLSEHIDWIIGIAMFLLAIGSILVLFKPGVTPVTNSETLLNLLQDKFTEETEWNITKLPIYVRPIKYTPLDSSGRSITPIFISDGAYVLKLKGDITITPTTTTVNPTSTNVANSLYTKMGDTPGNYYIELFYIADTTTEQRPTETTQATVETLDTPFTDARTIITNILGYIPPLDKDFGINFNYDSATPSLIFKTKLTQNPTTNNGKIGKKIKHLLIYNKNEIVNPATLTQETPSINACSYNCQTDPANPTAQCTLDNYLPASNTIAPGAEGCKAIYQLGVEEKVSGISILKFNGLNTIPPACTQVTAYNCLKTKWNIPSNYNFKIKISLPNTPQYSKTFTGTVVQPTNAKVFARTFNSQILTDDGEAIPIIVSLQVW